MPNNALQRMGGGVLLYNVINIVKPRLAIAGPPLSLADTRRALLTAYRRARFPSSSQSARRAASRLNEADADLVGFAPLVEVKARSRVFTSRRGGGLSRTPLARRRPLGKLRVAMLLCSFHHEAKTVHRNVCREFLTAQPSRNIVTAARQQITREWWQMKRSAFDLYVSGFVIREAGSGDPKAAAFRSEALKGIPEIALTEDAARLAEMLVQKGPLPEKAALDGLHVAVAVCGGVDYLLTWNFKHLANAAMRKGIERVCYANG